MLLNKGKICEFKNSALKEKLKELTTLIKTNKG